MKTMKKAFALLLAVVMVMGLSVTAFAAGNGSITITNASIGQTYNVYKIFDATLSADNTGISYTATSNQKTFYEGQTGNPFVFTENADGTYYVTIGTDSSTGEAYTAAQIVAFLQGFYKEDSDGNIALDSDFAGVVTAGTAQTATTSTVTFSGLDYGYYLVTSSLGAVVTIDSTMPTVNVIDKNTEEPTTDTNMKKLYWQMELRLILPQHLLAIL